MHSGIRKRFGELFLVMVLTALVAGVAHFVITNPLGLSRIWYQVQAPFIQLQTRCSKAVPQWLQAVQGYATRNMGAPASQLAWITPGGQLHHCETGWKDGIFGEQPIQPNNRFRFASVTKTPVAIIVLDLINEGELALDAKVIDILGLKGTLKDKRVGEITVGHLLSHRAGWDRTRSQDPMFMMSIKPWCPGSPEKLTSMHLMYNPGETESYSNLGYCLLGLVVEQVTGKSIREYASEYFDFANNTLSFVDGPFKQDEPKYDFRHENFYMEDYYRKFDFQAISSSAGLSGSASDLGLLVKNALDSRPLNILAGDMNGDCDPSKIQNCYGFGVYRYQPEGEKPLYIHGGKLPGATSAIIITPDKGVLVWLGAGVPPPGSNAHQEFYDVIRESISG
ncbi:beta-lactamase family protein [Marinobacter nauticus]